MTIAGDALHCRHVDSERGSPFWAFDRDFVNRFLGGGEDEHHSMFVFRNRGDGGDGDEGRLQKFSVRVPVSGFVGVNTPPNSSRALLSPLQRSSV